MDYRKKKDANFRERHASGLHVKPRPMKTSSSSKTTFQDLLLNSPSPSPVSSSRLVQTVPNNLIADFFECPICTDYALPPIYQCKAGHLICSNCRPKCAASTNETGSLCPTCRQPLDEIRNMALERISSLITFPCKFATFGCTSNLSCKEKVIHEDKCYFKIIRCPMPKNSSGSCTWQGKFDEVKKHIKKDHKEITVLFGNDIIFLAADITIPAPAEWIMMQEVYGKTFLVVLKKREYDNQTLFYAFAVLLGSHLQAKSYAYRFALNAPNKRLSWEAVPKSIYDEHSDWIVECLKVDSETAGMFAQNDDLSINVKSEYSSSESEDDKE